ncbi:hypothetical protein BX659_1595 [Orenia metallireducens]|jgi:hypothetical protein|uniref:Uncharacterized protein n=1 Tax=Orenia metallireducens TaxID=1413210 RepID=A0A285IJ91_9FIRM|nr:hypothetical protein [Orenia metallireducens]PRX16934.1 hypothetical protein BX659_1595 [Orenia metallireducens]SNY47827.1 hypothetical protein SAMN06265827_1595 [Orenia metallireducens]
MSISIRDFIYLDIERLKSIIAQVEEGLATTSSKENRNSQQGSASVEGGIFSFLKGIGGVNFLWENKNTETKSLHDNIYNKVENALIENELLIKISEYIKEEDLEKDTFRDLLLDNSFILATGKININDFTQMRMVLEKFNDIGDFIAKCTVADLPHNQRQKQLKKVRSNLKMDKWMQEGFKLFFDTFYKDRIVIKLNPFENYPDFRLVGNLNKEFLRDDISSIIYKYGTAPVSEWTIFGQIASIPPENRENIVSNVGGSDIEVALQQMFDVFREVEMMAQSVVYPEISITPIAIYRE